MRFSSFLLTSLLCGTTAIAQVKYFPIRGASANEGIEKFRLEWYSKQLTALQEPSLWEASKKQETESYRFLWLRTFHRPIAIRVDVSADGTSLLTAKMTSGAGGYDPGKLTQNQAITLTKEQTNLFLAQIGEHNFWKLPSVEEAPAGSDGAQWIIEGVRAQTYHVVDRWSPQDGDVRAMGLFMVNQLAKMKVSAKEVY
jgi:hypothetical protein